MRKKILSTVVYIIFITGQVISQQRQSPSTIPYEVTMDHTKQFWIDSENVEDKFLIKIYLPESYFTSTASTYPVIYLTDGDRYFGIASDFVYQLYRDEIDVILVGVAYGSRELNGEKRRRDYEGQPDENGRIGSYNYLLFLKEELFPKIEPEYRIDSSKRTIAGWSRGAMFTLNVLFKQPELFKNYIVLSPRLNYPQWSAIKLEENYFTRRKDLPAQLYLSMGLNDERHALFPAFVQNLQKRGYKDFKLMWDVFEGKAHDISALTEGLASGFTYMFDLEGIDEVLYTIINERGIQHAIAEYHRLLESDPDGYNFRESRLNKLGYRFLGLQKIEEAIEIFKLNVEIYPKSFNVYDSLGEAYMVRGDTERAIKNYKRSIELNPENANAITMIKKLEEE